MKPGPGAWVVGWGLRSAMGADPSAVAQAVASGQSGLRSQPQLAALPDDRAAVVPETGLRKWLKRRKDGKLLARPAALVLPACGEALGSHPVDRLALGVYLGVGREPPDSGDSEAALIASARDGALDPALLAGPGRDLYPPLLPLRTLPNMALAHVSIHLEVGGPNGAWAGGPEAGFQAVRAALHAIDEGRCVAALAGGTDSHVELGSARDQLRLGQTAPPGEAAAVLLLSTETTPDSSPLCRIRLVREGAESTAVDAARDLAQQHRPALGCCGAGDGALALLLACARVAAGGPAEILAAGQPAVLFEVSAT